MDFQLWIYYVIAILILTASPGPSVLLSVTTSIKEGFNSSIYTALGSLSAIIGIMTLSFTGLGVIIASSEFIFNIIKYTGSLYLIYIGYKTFTSKENNFDIKTDIKIQKSKKALFFSGFMVGASNPKAIIFFTALFPQFINLDKPMLLQYIILVSTFATLELFWLLFYAYLGDKSANWFLDKKRVNFFNKITGSIFMGAGAILSTTNRS